MTLTSFRRLQGPSASLQVAGN